MGLLPLVAAFLGNPAKEHVRYDLESRGGLLSIDPWAQRNKNISFFMPVHSPFRAKRQEMRIERV